MAVTSGSRAGADSPRYHGISKGYPMPDILIRDLPADDLALLDEQARRAGLTRSAYLRQRLHEQARRSFAPVADTDLDKLARLLPDLSDPEIMRGAWS